MNHFTIEGPLNEWIVLFHGTGGNEYSLLQIAGDIEPNAHVLSFLGDVDEGANRRFFAPLKAGTLDRADFDARIDAFLKDWPQLRPEQATRITFMGFSNGANFVLGLLEKEPAIADRVVLLHPSNLAYTFTEGSNAQIIVTSGAMDTLALPGDTMKLTKQLEAVFPNTTLKLLDGAHGMTEQEITYLQDTLR
ncbi:phospholipase/carboxylesterase [Kurthia sp. 3B1D]|uniref:Phospholipase/carboxylesterase n=1 Tax=Candidatus Kurthia intestinigallinarum TaxID=1562256 RepID=A0A433RXL0_9BACL|nr:MULTISPECIES: phospholipase [unclassified Kurthia]RUS58030.1 phospholipase/carboxylesterase [Kurthia sp. 3B1D]